MRLPQDYILHIESAKDGVHITAEWQGELVRCKDCRFYSNDHLCQQLSRFGSIEPLADFYCAFGKRREESEAEE